MAISDPQPILFRVTVEEFLFNEFINGHHQEGDEA
jgi:hypothetical protein